MRDKLIDFIESHTWLVRILLIVIFLVVLAFGIRACNKSRHSSDVVDPTEPVETEMESGSEETTEGVPDKDYQPSLGVWESESEGRVTLPAVDDNTQEHTDGRVTLPSNE